MTGVVERFVLFVTAMVLALLACLYVRHLQDELGTAEQAIIDARALVVERDRTIRGLADLANSKALAASALEGERNAIRDTLGTREILIRKLQDENAELRAWSAAALPDAVVGLRDHPTFTGAGAYRQFMSGGAALPAASRAHAQ